MVKIIKRTTDNKFLQSVETDTWVNELENAFEMSYKECEEAKIELFKTYSEAQIKEVTNFAKHKPISKEERKELLNILNKNK